MQTYYEIKDTNLVLQVSRLNTLVWPPHQHYFIEIIYAVKGLVSLDYWYSDNNLERITLSPGEMLFIFPNVLHSYIKPLERTNSEFIVMNFSPDVIPCYHDTFILKHMINPIIKAETLHEDVRYVLNKLANPHIAVETSEVIKSYLSLFLSRLLPFFPLDDFEEDYIQNSEAVKIINYINTNYSQELSLDSIARELGINKFNISRFFANNLQINFRSYLNSLRVCRAQSMLQNTDESITTIMMDCGYQNQQTFNRVFKEITGMTPFDYRKQYSGNLGTSVNRENGTIYFEQVDDTHQAVYAGNEYATIETIYVPSF